MKAFFTKLFYKLPYSIKCILASVAAYKNNNLRKGGNYQRYVDQLLKSYYDSLSDGKQLQEKLLKQLFHECYTYSTYYKKVFNDLGINDNEIENTDPFLILNRLPFLEKTTLKNNLDGLENNNPLRNRDHINFTSGTTGTPTIVYYDKESVQISFAWWRRFHHYIGLPEKFKSIRFSGRIFLDANTNKPPYWIYNMYDRQLFMSTYHLSENRLSAYVSKIIKFKPQLIDGYPSAIYIIAKYILNNNIKLGFSPTAIVTTAETLYHYQRVDIEKAFACKVYNQYASSEGGAFITECKEGKYHLNTDTGIFEFYNLENQPAKPGEFAELVITSFRNLKTPLIRYKSNDIVQLSEDYIPCSCGCAMPYVKEIIGREDDILYTSDRGYVGRMDTAYKGLDGIEKSQIIQRSQDLIEIYQIVNEKYTPEIEQKFMDNLRERLGNVVTIKIHQVEDIPLSKNGKFKAVLRQFKLQDF